MRTRLAVLAVHALVAAGCAAPPPAPNSPSLAKETSTTGALLPTAMVTTLAGERTELGRVIEGRVALVSFWATWCDSCMKEQGALNRLAKRTAGRPDALVIGVAVGETPKTVDAFARTHDLAFTQVVDEEFLLADALGQRRVPATLVVDRSGRVVYRGEALDEGSLAAFRKALGDAL